jgi:phosphatidylethanolamine-binding protein (PEBP) family uncharacterized protein
VFALDVAAVPLPEPFTGADLRAVIADHFLDEAMVWGTYTLNARLLG